MFESHGKERRALFHSPQKIKLDSMTECECIYTQQSSSERSGCVQHETSIRI